MSLKLYKITTTLEEHPDFTARLKNRTNEIYSFFSFNHGDVEQMKNIKIDFLAGAGYTLENIARDDENIPYWVVSELFMELCKKNNLSIRFKEV